MTRAVVTLPSDNEILMVREFPRATPADLYRAWTEPELVKRWWAGPLGTVVAADIDLRVGGRWRWVMQPHGGPEIVFHGEYHELVPDELIVTTNAIAGNESGAYRHTAAFSGADGGAVLSLRQEHSSTENRDAHFAGRGMAEDGPVHSSLDALEQLVDSLRA